MPPSRHNEAEQAEALDLYAKFGAAEAARTTGIEAATIRQWASRSGMSRDKSKKTAAACEANRVEYQNRRLDLACRTCQVAASTLEYVQVAGDMDDARAAKDYAVAYGVLVDKMSALTACIDAVSPGSVNVPADKNIEELRHEALEAADRLRRKNALLKGPEDPETNAQ
jgi:hypothetical protein